MEDLYGFLQLQKTASKEDIIKSYQEHINRYNGLPFLTKRMISEIKNLKKAYYVLSNDELRKKYDNNDNNNTNIFFAFNEKEDDMGNTKINDRLFGDIFKKKL